MRIAVTYDGEQVFQHFGHTKQFMVYDAAGGKITAKSIVSTNGSGHGALADILKEAGADTLICGGIGAGAQRALSEAGIKLYGGVAGSADKAVEALLANTLIYDPHVSCSHHDEHHHHEPGDTCSCHSQQ